MKRISIWARNHIWQSRLIIFLLYIVLNVIGLNTGRLFKDLDIVIPTIYLTACIIFTIFLWAFYPSKTNKGFYRIFPSSYSYRKVFDFLLVAVTFLMIVYTGNNLKYFIFKNDTAMAYNIIPFSKEPPLYQNPLLTNFITTIRKMDVSKLTQREKIRIIKNQIKTIKKDKATSKSDKTLLIILSIFVAIFLFFGISALACNISCAGSEALALIVFIGGTFLIIFFLVRFIKRLNHPRNKKKPLIE